MMDIIARTHTRPHLTVAEGVWWVEYRVRPLTDVERQTEHYMHRWVLEVRHCHDVADGCSAHDGIWRPMEYGRTMDEPVRGFIGDDQFRKAESLAEVHRTAVVIENRARRIRKACEVLYRATHHEYRMLGEVIVKEIDVVADERARAEERFARALKAAKLYSKAAKGTAPQEKVDAIKAQVRAEYKARVGERQRRHAAMLRKWTELANVV